MMPIPPAADALLFRLVPTAVFSVDRQRRITAWNPAAERITGWTAGEVIGQPCTRLMLDPCGERCGMFDPGVPVEVCNRACTLRNRDGRRLEVLKNAQTIEHDGVVVGAIESFVDITAQKRTEEELRRSQELFRLAVAGSQDGIWDWNLRDNTLYLSPQWKKMIGYADDELPNSFTVFEERLHPDDRDRVQNFVRRYLAGEEPIYRIEFRFRHRDGGWLWILARGEALRDAEGRPYRMAGSHTDLTWRKALEDELRAAHDEAQQAMRAKTFFLANMSHEIRTPMNGVMGMTELLLGSSLTPEQREYASTIYGSAEALLGILDGILDFSKIEAEQLRLERIAFDLHRLVHDVADLHRSRIAEGCVELLVRLAPGLPRRVLGDPGRVRQILNNLLSNAVKFTAQGQVLIDGSAEGDVVRLEVVDTGIGIPADRLPLVFAPFMQVDASTSRRYGGTGLGLTISRRLAELMAGTLTATSRLGEGSTFTLRLPLPAAESEEPHPVAGLALAGERILVVDDHPLAARIIAEQLGILGAAADIETQAASVLARLAEAAAAGTPFAAVLIDQRMPGMDAPALAAAVRSDPVHAGVVLVLLGAHAARGDAGRMQAAGFAGYLVKPVRLDVLGEVVTDAIARVRSGRGGMATRHSVAEAGPCPPVPRLARPLRVLLAEDDEINRRVAQAMLARIGAEVVVVADGQEAIERTAVEAFDVVLMDCQMPGTDGYAATAAIRIREAGRPSRRLPIIALTASAMPGDRERCLAAGMDDHLPKPVQEAQLAAVLRRCQKAIPSA